jgi:hypothetical protein
MVEGSGFASRINANWSIVGPGVNNRATLLLWSLLLVKRHEVKVKVRMGRHGELRCGRAVVGGSGVRLLGAARRDPKL